MATATKRRLGTKARGDLSGKFDQRGHARAHLWTFFSPKAGIDVGLLGNRHFAHALLLEGDPSVATVNYSPPERQVFVSPQATTIQFHVELETTDGTLELRMVKKAGPMEPEDPGASEEQLRIQAAIQALEFEGRACRYVLMTDAEIYANPVRLRNWFEALPWIAQARYHSLSQSTLEVAALIHAEGDVTLAELLEAGGPLYVAAALKGVSEGAFGSDINQSPMTARTTFSAQRRHRGRAKR